MYQHLNTNNVLVIKQSDARTKPSTVKATYNLISEILDSLNNKKWLMAYFVTWKRPVIVLAMTFYH
jgi:hypothetical protein